MHKIFFCDTAKASHDILLCRIEQGEIKHYGEIERIDGVLRTNAQRQINPLQGHQYSKKSVKMLAYSCHVYILPRETVLIPHFMKHGALCTSTFTLNASHLLAQCLVFPLLNIQTN